MGWGWDAFGALNAKTPRPVSRTGGHHERGRSTGPVVPAEAYDLPIAV